MVTPRAVLFDFDFTLADPAPWLIPAWRAALAEIGAAMPDEERLRRVIGRPLEAQFAGLTGEPVEGPRFAAFEAAYVAYRDAHAIAETVLFPGVGEAIERLAAAGFRLGVVSTGAPRRITGILRRHGLDRRLETIEAGWRDKAEGLAAAARTIGVAPQEILYTGDHPTDAEACARAGVAFVAVLTGAHGADAFPPGTPAIPSFAALPEYTNV